MPAAPPNNAQVWDPGATAAGGGFAGFGPSPIIMPQWGDNTVQAGSVWIDNTSGTHCTVTWLDNAPFGGGATPFTAQVTLYDTGEIVVCLDDRCQNIESTFGAFTTVVGILDNSSGTIPAASDFSAGPVATPDQTVFEEFVGPGTGGGTVDPNYDVTNSTLRFIPTNPGWVVTTDPLVCATKTQYGAGCDGLSLDSNEPVIGASWDVTLTGINPISPIGIIFFGAARTQPGVPLSVLGIDSPGCTVDIAMLLSSLSAANVAGAATVSIAVPLNATLKGATLTCQGLGLTPAVPSLIGTSNGLEGLIGY